jgi:hypothetical protein
MDTNQQQDDGDGHLAGDLLVGADAIRDCLIASKRRLARHADKIARGPTAA